MDPAEVWWQHMKLLYRIAKPRALLRLWSILITERAMKWAVETCYSNNSCWTVAHMYQTVTEPERAWKRLIMHATRNIVEVLYKSDNIEPCIRHPNPRLVYRSWEWNLRFCADGARINTLMVPESILLGIPPSLLNWLRRDRDLNVVRDTSDIEINLVSFVIHHIILRIPSMDGQSHMD
jgi:hypothetical protein